MLHLQERDSESESYHIHTIHTAFFSPNMEQSPSLCRRGILHASGWHWLAVKCSLKSTSRKIQRRCWKHWMLTLTMHKSTDLGSPSCLRFIFQNSTFHHALCTLCISRTRTTKFNQSLTFKTSLFLATKIRLVPHTEKHFVICKTYKGDLQIATRSPVKVKLRLENPS